MKVLVTGSRKATLDDHGDFIRVICDFNFACVDVIVHGAAPGVDSVVAELFNGSDVELRPYPANWDKWGRSAGPIRNQTMLEMEHLYSTEKIDLVLAFPTHDSKGTWDMVERAVKARIPVRVYPLS